MGTKPGPTLEKRGHPPDSRLILVQGDTGEASPSLPPLAESDNRMVI